jgi:ADP-ribose pyrophosphatase
VAEGRAAGAPGPGDPLAEVTLESATAYDGVFFRVVRDRVRSADGHESLREYIHHPGASMIVPLLDADTVLLERQYRHPLRRTFIEMPAGKREAGEDPLACAQRELREETGYRAARWTRLGAFNNAIGYADEEIVVFLAQDLDFVGGTADAGEVIETFPARWRELLDWIAAGRVTDVKTIIGAYWLERHLAARGPGAAP